MIDQIITTITALFIASMGFLMYVTEAPAQSVIFDERTNAVGITGFIENQTYEDLTKIVMTNKVEQMIIRSEGGSFWTAVQIGIWVYKNEIPVTAHIECHSACGYIWLASPVRGATNTDTPVSMMMHLPYYEDRPNNYELAIEFVRAYFASIDLEKDLVLDFFSRIDIISNTEFEMMELFEEQ